MLNNVCLMGRLTANPELKYTPTGIPFTRFTLAVGRSYVKPGEERQTDFIDIIAWRKTAEFASRYFKKGQLAAIEGSIQTRQYEAKDGTKRKVFEISANGLHFAESKKISDELYNSNNQSENSLNNTLDNLSEMTNKNINNEKSFSEDDLLSEDDLPF